MGNLIVTVYGDDLKSRNIDLAGQKVGSIDDNFQFRCLSNARKYYSVLILSRL